MREHELNLIPGDLIAHEVLRERVKFWIFIATSVFLFLFFIIVLIKVINNSVLRDITISKSKRALLSREMEGFKQHSMQDNELLNFKGKIQGLSRKGPSIDIFSAIDKAINNNITLTHIEAKFNYPHIPTAGQNKGSSNNGYFSSNTNKKASGNQAADKDSVLIHGTASSNTDIASMLSILSEQSLFKEVNLKYSRTEESERGKSIKFEVECKLNNVEDNGQK